MSDPVRKHLISDLIVAGVPTINNFVYSHDLLKRMVTQINEKAEHGQLLGRIGFSPSTKTELRLVSHKVLPTARMVDGKLEVDIEILETPEGKRLKTLLDFPLRALVSGVGAVRDSVVQEEGYVVSSVDVDMIGNTDVQTDPKLALAKRLDDLLTEIRAKGLSIKASWFDEYGGESSVSDPVRISITAS